MGSCAVGRLGIVRLGLMVVALTTCGCGAMEGDSAGTSQLDIPVPGMGSVLGDFRTITLSGFTFEPQIAILNSEEELFEWISDPEDVGVNIDFSSETAIYVSWYLPDTCAMRELISLVKEENPEILEVTYRTDRNEDSFCPQIIKSFEQLLVTNTPYQAVKLVIDEELLAEWPGE